MRRIGILTSGGDAPGMNAAVMSVARAARHYGLSLIGIKRGYNGTLCRSNNIADDMIELDLDTVLDIADRPGTYLRTARCLDFLKPEMQQLAANNIRAMGVEGVVVIGGDGSYKGARELCRLGIPCVGIPGTIDNDLAYTEMTLGYDTAVNSCVDDIRAIRATSRSHDRPAVVEVMGRHCGDIALKASAGTGAEICIVPEVQWSIIDVADRLNVSRQLLDLRFRQVLASTVSKKITEIRLANVATMLTNTSLSIKEIAAACDFSDSFHLMHSFRRRYGLTMNQYRAVETMEKKIRRTF